MQAGRGAEEQAQRMAARLERDRAAPGADPEKIAAAEARQQAWAVGAEGERITARHLVELEGAGGWRVLHDVRWPGRPKANIDHIAVGPGGIVIIDSKNWAEPVRAARGTLWRGRYPSRKEADELLRMVAAVAALLPAEQRRHVSSALCVVQQDLAPTVMDGGVVAVGGTQLAPWLRSLPPVVDAGAVRELTRSLAALLDSGPGRGLLTTADLDRTPARSGFGASPRVVRPAAAPRRPATTSPALSQRAPARPTPPRRPAPVRTPAAAGPRRPRRSGRRVDRYALFKLALLGVAFLTAPAWVGGAQAGLTQLLVEHLVVTPVEVPRTP